MTEPLLMQLSMSIARLIMVCESNDCTNQASIKNFYENRALCSGCDSVWYPNGRFPLNVIRKMHLKFEMAMVDRGYSLDNQRFTNIFTKYQVDYQEAFQFWCQSQMRLTPPPF
jgi:hypothetical protein